MRNYLAALVFSLICADSLAGDPMVCEKTIGESKWALQCQKRSQQPASSLSKLLPGRAICAKLIPMRKSQNTRCRWYPVKSSHIPGLIAEAFYSSQKGDRDVALEYLEKFCQRPEFCREYSGRIDTEVKANILSWQKTMPDLLSRAEKLRDSLSRDLNSD